jgi:capsular polysaccharide biosynthesis protein/Mrp family chromosome partitioning ATPase
MRRWWWLLAVGTAAAAFVGFLVASRVPPTYEAQSRLLVGPVSGGDKDTLQAAGAQARTYAEVATASPILRRAVTRVGLQRSPAFLKSKVTVTASDITRLISIRARDRNSQLAAAMANALARELIAWASRPGISPPQGKLSAVEFASPPSKPSGPSMLVILPLAAVAGLLGALGLAAVADSVMTVVRDEEDLAAVAPVSFLGAVDGRSSARSNPLVVDARPASDAAAAYRLLAAKIEMSGPEGLPRSLLLLETRDGSSGGRLTANLAAVLTKAGRRVVLLDAGERDDLTRLFAVDGGGNRRKTFARRARPLRVGQVTLDRFRVRSSDFAVVRPRPRPEGLGAHEAAETIDSLLGDADLVLLTASSSDRSAESLAWSRVAQATVVIAESGHTKPEHIRATLEALRIVNANVIGTVLCRDSLF